MSILHKYRTSKFGPDIESGPQARACTAAFQHHDSYEEIDKGEQTQHHDLLRHKDAFGRSPDLRSVKSKDMITTTDD